jgi:hypothetical protein
LNIFFHSDILPAAKMAKLLAFYNLCPISDTKECLGVAKDAEPGTIINTFGRNMAIVMKVNTLGLFLLPPRSSHNGPSLTAQQPEAAELMDGARQILQ